MKDIKKLGIPNVCFSLDKSSDKKRQKKYKKQRKKRGFDDSELWSLSNTIASFLIPRLKTYLKVAGKVIVIEPKRKKKIKNLIKAFELINRDGGTCMFSEKEDKLINKAFKNFQNIFWSLWY